MAKQQKAKDVEFATKEFNVYFPFTSKAVAACAECGSTPCTCDEPSGKIIKIEGYANFCGDLEDEKSTFIDHCGDVMVPSGFDLSVWKKNPQILWQHDRDKTIGKGLKATKEADGLMITAEIHEDAMEDEDFYKVDKGLVSMLSVGFRTLAGEFREINKQQVFFITKALLYEVSVVSIPMNAKSGFSIIKSFGDEGAGFYAGDINFDPKASHGAENKSIEEDEKMKLKLRELLPEDKVKELEGMGLSEKLDELQDVDTKSFFETLIAKHLDTFKSEILATVDEKIKASEPAAETPPAEGEAAPAAEEGAGEEEGTPAEGDAPAAEDEKDTDVESIKALSDIITNLKALAAEEK